MPSDDGLRKAAWAAYNLVMRHVRPNYTTCAPVDEAELVLVGDMLADELFPGNEKLRPSTHVRSRVLCSASPTTPLWSDPVEPS